MINIAIDASGGDNAPHEIIKGVAQAKAKYEFNPILVGQEREIKKHLNGLDCQIVNAEQIITNDESPTQAVRQKKDSSIVVGSKLLKEKKADAFISAGSTGAVLTAAIAYVGRIEGIERPALATLMPTERGFSMLLDIGANVDAKPQYLAQFAQMGSVYMQHIMKVDNPKVGLVNIGAEKEKGNALTKEAYGLLENLKINFIGNIEARDIMQGHVDVIVCDAFVGNVILKLAEGLSETLFSIIKQEIMAKTMTKIGGALMKPGFRNIKKRFDYSEYGGAAFLGLNALVVKAHGSSNARAIENSIKQCLTFVEKDITVKIHDMIGV